MEGNGAVGLIINDFKLDLMDPISLDVTSPRGTALTSAPKSWPLIFN